MSIEHYQTPEAIARLDEIGWPEWTKLGWPRTLRFAPGVGWAAIESATGHIEDMVSHLALCILRNHLREWLERQAVRICVEFNGKRGPSTTYYLERDLCNEDGYYEGDGGREVLTVAGWHRWNKLGDAVPRYFDDLDAALLAGAEAMPKGKD